MWCDDVLDLTGIDNGDEHGSVKSRLLTRSNRVFTGFESAEDVREGMDLRGIAYDNICKYRNFPQKCISFL